MFVKQDENLREEYDNFYSLKDMFIISGVGICSKRDNIVFQNSKEKLIKLLNDFINKDKEELYKLYDIGEDSRDWELNTAIKTIKENENALENHIMKCHFRPFDKRFVYYDTNKVERARKDIMEHFLKNDNIGLISNRSVALNMYKHTFITDMITDLHIMETANASAYIFPLYLYNTPNAIKNIQSQDYGDTDLFKKTASNPFKNADKIENFTVNFRKFIDEKYSSHFSPEDILGYIYAVLFHKTYRTKYIDFLKIDFPKIPFTDSKDIFIKLSELGTQLYNLHLMKDNNLNNDVGEGLYKDDKNNKIEKPLYNEKENKLFINKSLYFDKVSKEVWLYKIGGYQVLDKYLKSHKDEEIDYSYFQKIIQILDKSIILEKEISDINLF